MANQSAPETSAMYDLRVGNVLWGWGGEEARRLGQPQNQIHILDSLRRRAFEQVVDRESDDEHAIADRPPDVAERAAGCGQQLGQSAGRQADETEIGRASSRESGRSTEDVSG